MSSIPLNPVAAKKIEQFQLRYLHQRIATTIAYASLIFVLSAIVGMLLDHWFELSTFQRYALTTAIYAIIVGIAIWNQRRNGAGKLSAGAAASRIENLAPQVKQYLLAAVELSENRSLGSIPFCQKVQEQAGMVTSPVAIPQLLPWKNTTRPVAFALVALAALLASMFLPNWNVAQRLTRVFLPMLNIGRVSAYRVEVISPSPATNTVAWNDMVLVQAIVQGPNPTKAVIQFRNSAAAKLLTANMDLDAGQTFSGMLTCDSSSILYRVVAHGASSAWYRLDAQYRPKLIDVDKRYQLPKYTQSPEIVLKEDHGDLRQIQGTRAQVAFNVDQALSQMRIIFQTTKDTLEEIQLEKRTNRQWIGEIELNKPAKYRLEMVSASGLRNAPTRLFVVEPAEDQPPQIAWDDSLKFEPLVHRQQELQFGACVKDEFPVQSIAELARINGSQWLSTTLHVFETEVDVSVIHKTQWSRRLKELPLRPGDVLEVKLQALDCKGQSAESTIKRFIVAAELIADRDMRYIFDRLDLADALRWLRKDTVEQAAAILAVVDAEQKKPTAERDYTELEQTQKKLTKQTKLAADRAMNVIDTALESVQNSAARNEVERQGQLIAKILHQTLPKLDTLANLLEQKMETLSENDRNRLASEYQATLHQLRDHVTQLDERARVGSQNDVLMDLVKDVEAIKKAQQSLDPLGSAEQQTRQQNLIAEELEQLSRKASIFQPRLTEEYQNIVDRLNSTAIGAAEKIREQLEQKVAISEISKQTLDRLQQVSQARGRLAGAIGELANGSAHLVQRAGSVSEDIEPLAAAIDQTNHPGRSDYHEQTILKQLIPALRQLSERRELQRLRPDCDVSFTSDVGTAARAVGELLVDRQSDPHQSAKKLREVARALGQLEAVHQARQAAAQLDELIFLERWQADSAESFLEVPRIWEDVPHAFAAAANNLRRFGGPNELAGQVDNLRWNQNASQAAQKLGQRRWDQNFKVTTEHDLRALKADYDLLTDALDQVARQARESLAQHAPSIAELARRAAEESRELSNRSSELQQATEREQVPDVPPQLARLERLQDQAATRTHHLQQALNDLSDSQQQLFRRDASSQSGSMTAEDSHLANQIAAQAREKILESLEHVDASSQSNAQVSSQLKSAAEQQAAAAEMLDKIARHFENSEAKDLEQSRNELQQIAQSFSKDDEHTSQPTDRLKAIADSDPHKLLEQLEEMLPKNAAMQEELDQIANGLDQRAERVLDFAAAKERQIRSQIENSDASFQQRKRDLAEQLRQASGQLEDFANQFAQQAINITHRDKNMQDEREQIQLAQQKLQQATSAGRSASADAPVSELKELQLRMQESVQQAGELLSQQSNNSRQQVDENSFDKPENLSRVQRELNNQQEQIQKQRSNHASQLVRQSEQQLKQAENQLNQRKQELDRREKAAAQSRQKLDADPKNEGLKNQNRAANEQVASAQRDTSVAAQQMEAAQQRVENAKLTQQRIQQQASPPISKPNPVAESIANFTQRAAEETRQAAELLQRANPQDWMDNFETPHQGLASATQDQRSVTQAVHNTASDLSRAARHDSRLQDSQQAQRLQQHANDIEALADGKLNLAANQLQSAAEQTKPTDASAASRANAQTGNELRHALVEAEQSLRAEAKKLSDTNASGVSHNSSIPSSAVPNSASAKAVQDATTTNSDPNQSASSGNSADSGSSAEQSPDLSNLFQAWQASLFQADANSSSDQPSSNASSTPASSQAAVGAATDSPLTSRQLAQLLDELDQQLSRDSDSNNANPQSPSTPANDLASNSNKSVQSTVLSQAMRQIQAEMSEGARLANRSSRAEQRSSMQNHTGKANGQSQLSVNPSGGAGQKKAAGGSAFAEDPNRASERIWGKLRSKQNEDAVKSEREQVAPKFRGAVENYFRMLAEQEQDEK